MSNNDAKIDAAWTVADRISDRIVDLVNDELAAMRREHRTDPMQLFAGILLGLLALDRTAPSHLAPDSYQRVIAAARACLNDYLAKTP